MPSVVLAHLSKTMKTSFAIAKATLETTGLTAARTFTLPNRSGIVGLAEDIPPYNAIINGDMRIGQRGTSFTTTAEIYTLDRWLWSLVGAARHTVTRDTDAPTFAQAGRVFSFSLKATLTTADDTIAAGDTVNLRQSVEGYNWAPLAQRINTLSFWVKAGLTGIYCASLRNSIGDRSCVLEFTIDTADTWEYKTLTFPASPSAGTWDYVGGAGVHVTFALASGSDFQTTAGTWQTGNFIATANQVNGVATGAGNFLVTAVVLEAGNVASPFTSRLVSDELAHCQRYYQIANVSARFQAAGANNYGQAPIAYAVAMRTVPSGTITAGQRNNLLAGTPALGLDVDGGRFEIASNAAGDTYALLELIKMSAEL